MDFKEKWKPIENYEYSYEVSNKGRIRSKERVDRIGHPWHPRIIKPYAQKSGYLNVSLSDGQGNSKKFLVHRLVAKAFVNNPNDLKVVNHIDENVQNNDYLNLEWCTTKYNLNYGNRGKRASETIKNNPDTIKRLKKMAEQQRKKVIQFTKSGEFVKEWPSTYSTKQGGFKPGGVSSCCLGKTKTHHNFIWKFASSVDDTSKIVDE